MRVINNARTVCALVIAEVINEHTHLDQALIPYLETLPDPRERSLARELSYGTLRWYHRLTFIANRMLKKPFKRGDADMHALLCSGLYQLGYLRIPDHAAISTSVEAARTLGKPWACNLINAVLRRYQREKTALDEQANRNEEALYSHPRWLIERLRADWAENWQTILQANNEYPPLQLRVNPRRQSRDEYLQMLAGAGLEASACDWLDTGITVHNPVNVNKLPGFAEGAVSVQDYGAQLAAVLLDAAPGHSVLDACAAPGGKSAHILERTPDLARLVAIENDAGRFGLLRDTLGRLGLGAKLIQADAGDVSRWWDGKPFDRILIDAPCSATGVIRRHPDIKLLRSSGQIQLFATTQAKLLESLWPLLKPGGRLLYSTCSIIHSESDDQIASFVRKYDDTAVMPIKADWGVSSSCGRYILPGHRQTDGFYYALITKNPER